MITLIEQQLSSCSADKFANLCRLYLSYKYEIVNSTGFALGKEKSKKGTPDNFIPVRDFYFFNEITTIDKTRLVPKLKQDIQHCFKQTDVPKEKILKIILICNSKITTAIQEELNKYKNSFSSNVGLEVVGIDALATIIFKDYPSIARELGISIDTGQILEVDEFVRQYEKSKFSTPLSNRFFNRSKELQEGVSLLQNNDFLIISGQAGVGKTKFSLELVKEFKKNNKDYIIKYVRANGILDIWEDLKIQFVEGKNYLIVIDDANKLKSNLDLLINFKNSINSGSIKLIFTVRNYVKEEIHVKLKDYSTIELKIFNREELKTILQSPDFNIIEYYTDKIYSISKGNPRIAIMAAIAGINKELEKLNNASLILDEYFSSVSEQLKVNGEIIKTAGVLSLFRAIDFSNNDVTEEIEKYFNISKNDLVENLELLYRYEIADEFNGSFKISDQILGEYIFYLVFIKQKQIPFSLLLDIYVDENKFSLVKLLTPIVSNYGFENIKLIIIDDLKRKFSSLKENDKCLKFLKDFWFYLPTESLVFINNLVSNNSAADKDTLSFEIYEKNLTKTYQDSMISILINFDQFADKFELALDLLMKYGLISNLNFTKLLKVFTQSFTYEKYDSSLKYSTQIRLFEYLYEKTIQEDAIFYSKIILFIAHKYLVDSYESNVWDGNTVYFNQNPTYLTDEQKSFRIKLWNFIFDCYQNENLKEFVLDFFARHKYGHRFNQYDTVIKFDKKLVIDFFLKSFLPNPDFRETKIAHRFLKNLELSNIRHDKRLKGKFKNKDVELWNLLSDRDDHKREALYKYIDGLKIKDYKRFLIQIDSICLQKKDHSVSHSISESLSNVYIRLAETDFSLFLKVFELVFTYKYSDQLFLEVIFKNIKYDENKVKQIRTLIGKNKIPKRCIVHFLRHLPIDFIIFQDYELLMEYFRDEKTVWIVFIEDIFGKFKKLDIDLEIEINGVLDRLVEKRSNSGFYLHNDFFKYLYEDYNNIFVKRLDDIQNLYLAIDKLHRHFDYQLEILKLILIVNPHFIDELLKLSFDEKTTLSRNDLFENDFRKLWSLENRNEIFEYIIIFFSKFRTYFTNVRSEVASVFHGSGEDGFNFLHDMVFKTKDEKVLKLAFNIVVTEFNERKYDFLDIILKKNSEKEFFKSLDFYAGNIVSINGRIPQIKETITVYEDLKDFLQSLKNLKYLEHISVVENKIISYKAEIEWERKNEFLREWSF